MIKTAPSLESLPKDVWHEIAEYTPKEIGVGGISTLIQQTISEVFKGLHRQYLDNKQIRQFMPLHPNHLKSVLPVVVLKTAQAINRWQLPESPIDIRPNTLTSILKAQDLFLESVQQDPSGFYNLLIDVCDQGNFPTMQAIFIHLDQTPFSPVTRKMLEQVADTSRVNGHLPQMVSVLVQMNGQEGAYFRDFTGCLLVAAARYGNLQAVKQLVPMVQAFYPPGDNFLENALISSAINDHQEIFQFLSFLDHQYSEETLMLVEKCD